jgi:hypothetical protein
MASLVLLRNPLAPHTRETYVLPEGTRVIDWLQEHHPQGFGMPCQFHVNGVEKPLDDLDYALGPDDVAVIAVMPGIDPASISLSAILIQLAISAILAGASLALNYFFRPKEASGSKNKPITIYDVSSGQNAAKLGDAVPVVYGSVLTVPDYVAQPYTVFNWSQANYGQNYNGVQYLNLLLCVGQGNIDVAAVYLGDTVSTTPPTDVVTWQAFKPADHLKTMGTIATAMGGGFHENVVTSPEVSNQEFIDTNDAAGYFATCKSGNKGRYFEIDIVFPGGQTNPTDGGNVKGRTTQFRVYWQELDDNDTPVGSAVTKVITASTDNSTSVTSADGGTVTTTSSNEKNKTQIGAPIRRSYKIDTGRSARWAVKVERITASPDAVNGTDRFIWAGLKLYADYPSGTVYGDVTLLAVQIKASQGIGNDASVRIRVRANRRLQPPGGGTEVATTSGAYAFADVYTNATYGAKRPSSELDLTTLAALDTKWAGYQFNYVFTDRITVWEALRTITTPFGAEPVPVGPVMSVVQDGVKAVRSALFTDANIIENSITVGYSFDEEGATDGVEIEYVNPVDFRPSYALYPSTSLRPEQFSLPGVTSATHAAQYALLTWQRRQGQRKRVTFDTELEGLLLQLGDRIGVAHDVPKWGDSGLVIAVSGLTLTVDHDLDWSGGTKQIVLRAPDGSVTNPITVTRGVQNHDIVLPSSPGITINVDNDYDYTSFAFGSSTSLVRDFIVVATTPSGENTVTVEAVNYAPAIYTGAMTYMST